MSDEVFYRTRTGGSKRALHLDENCSQLADAYDVREVQREWYPDSPICSFCRGENEQPTPDRSTYEKALSAGGVE